MRRNPDGSFMILNPGKPKRKRRARRAKAKKTTRRRRARAYTANPVANPRRRRRRRSSASGKRRRSYRRNPSRAARAATGLASPLPLPKIGKFDIGFAIVGGIGTIGHGMATNIVAGYIPLDVAKTPAGKVGVGLALGVVGSWGAWKFLPRNWAVPLIAGMSTSVAVQAYNAFVLPNFPQMPVSGVESLETLEGIAGLGELQPFSVVGGDDRFVSPY